MVIDLAEHRLNRQLRSASAAPPAPGSRKAAPLSTAVVLTWRKVSPSAHLMVDPRNGARAVIRDIGADGGRFLWSVLAAGEMDPMSEGRTDELAQARSICRGGSLRLCRDQWYGCPACWRRLGPSLDRARPALAEGQGCGFTRTPSLRKKVSA